MFDMSMGMIVSGLILSAVGLVLFLHGKREADFRTLFAGIALGILPMVVHSVLILWGISAAVLGGVWALKRYA